jgi:hypothetical protein
MAAVARLEDRAARAGITVLRAPGCAHPEVEPGQPPNL